MNTCCHIYTWGLLSYFFVHSWAFLANDDMGNRLTSVLTKRDWEIYLLLTKRDWEIDARVQIKADCSNKLLWEQYINTSVSNSIKHMPQSSLRCLWQVRMWLCLSRLRFFGWLYNPNISLPVLMPFLKC